MLPIKRPYFRIDPLQATNQIGGGCASGCPSARLHGIAGYERHIARRHVRPSRPVHERRHYLAVAQRRPGALRDGAAFVDIPPAINRLQSILLERPRADREMVEILALVLPTGELTLDSSGTSEPARAEPDRPPG